MNMWVKSPLRYLLPFAIQSCYKKFSFFSDHPVGRYTDSVDIVITLGRYTGSVDIVITLGRYTGSGHSDSTRQIHRLCSA